MGKTSRGYQPRLSTDATLEILLRDINEPPLPLCEGVSAVEENSAIGTLVKSMGSSDTDVLYNQGLGQTLTYQIRGDGACLHGEGLCFEFEDGRRGYGLDESVALTLSGAISFETSTHHYLRITVKDDGDGDAETLLGGYRETECELVVRILDRVSPLPLAFAIDRRALLIPSIARPQNDAPDMRCAVPVSPDGTCATFLTDESACASTVSYAMPNAMRNDSCRWRATSRTPSWSPRTRITSQ